jgi:hypothetical protein
MRVFVTLFAAVLVAGCTKSITSRPLGDNADKDAVGVYYFLPKSVYKVTATYTVTATLERRDGIVEPGTNPKVVVGLSEPVKLEVLNVPDHKNGFIASGLEMSRDWRVEGKTSIAVSATQLLTAVSADVTDKSPEAVQSAVASVLKIAKTASFGTLGVGTIKLLRLRLQAIDNEIGKILEATGDDPMTEANQKKLEALLNERKRLLESIAAEAEANKPIVSTATATYVTYLDPSDSSVFDVKKTYGKHEYRCATVNPPKGFIGVGDVSAATFFIGVLVTDSAMSAAASPVHTQVVKDKKGKDRKVVIDGIVHRIGYPVETVVLVQVGSELEHLSMENFSLAQYGRTAIAPITMKPWAKLKTEVNFDASSGYLTSYGTDTTSSAVAATKAMSDSVSDLNTLLAAAKNKEKTELDNEAALEEAKKKLAEAKLGRIKAEAELDAAQNPPATPAPPTPPSPTPTTNSGG